MAVLDTLQTPRTLPHSEESERAVLAGILLEPEVLATVASRLVEGDFYFERHQRIYRAMIDLQGAATEVDLRTLQARLEQQGHIDAVGGLAYLAGLDVDLPDLGRIDSYVEIVKERSLRRRLIQACSDVTRSALDGGLEANEALGKAEQAILGLGEEAVARGFVSLGRVLDKTMEDIEERPGSTLIGIPTGFTDLDRMTHGLNKGNLIIIAGRPGQGKTSLALNIAQYVAVHQNKPVGVFSLEMSEQELALRILCSEADVSFSRLRAGHLSQKQWQTIVQTVRRLSPAPLFIDDSPNPSILEVASKTRRLRAELGLELIILDYLQLMQAGGRYENRNLEIAAISRSLKQLAKELEIPVIALSQLSRQPERRSGDHRPQLADLRESGCLTGDTLVTLADSGARVAMRDLAGQTGFAIWAVDGDSWTLKPATVAKAFSTGVKPVFRLSTRLGRTIRATANHRFLTIEGWRRLDELTPGCRLAMPRRLASPSVQTMHDSELALLGHLIGDGCTLPRHVLQYTTREIDLAETVATLATDCFGDRVRPRINRERQWFQVYLPSAEHHTHGRRNAIAEWLEPLGGVWGRGSWEKRLPAAIFQQPAAAIAKFVRHLWATDGCVRPSGTGAPAIYYATSSAGLAHDLQALLLRLDLQARVERHPQRGKGRDQYHVRLSSRSQLLGFAERVGAVGRYKTDCLRQVVEQIEGTTENTNRDVVPREVWQLYVRPAMIAAGVTHRELHTAIGMAYSGMTTFRQNLGRQRALAVALATSCEALRRLAESDLYWDHVVSIEAEGEEEVFDLTVPGPHNFVADDIVVHNSIEQDADLVAFVYRDELYNPDDPSVRGLAELIVAKHRNGETGTVELVFLGETTTFKNRAPDYLAGGPPH
ncbi:MAG TPA: replicative DNA helicase [Thermoanaerobaculia bacterium]|nr:replicative DNA helicase [Thermoanaerobaculia bacterium]